MISEPSTAWQRSTTYRVLRWATHRRTLKRTALTAVWIVTLIALSYGIANWRGRRAWDAERRRLEARGSPVDFSQVIPKPVPDEQNFAATPFIRSWFEQTNYSEDFWKDDYERAVRLVKDPRKSVNQHHWTDLDSWAGAMAIAATNASPKPSRTDQPWPKFPSRAAAAAVVLKGFESSEWWRRGLQEALKRPEIRYPVAYSLQDPWGIRLPHLAKVKTACNRLSLRASAHVAAGHSQEALEDIFLIQDLAESLQSEPFLISFLVRLACLQLSLQPVWEGLASSVWTDAQLQELDARLERIETFTGLDHTLQSERAVTVLTADLLANGTYRLGRVIDQRSWEAFSSASGAVAVAEYLIPRGWYHREKVEYSRLLEEWMANGWTLEPRRMFPAILRENLRQVDAQLEIPPGSEDSAEEFDLTHRPASLRDVIRHRLLAKLVLRELRTAPPKAAAAQVAVDQARIACALERSRLATGEFPLSLSTLAPRFISAVPKDPLTGEDYRFRREVEGGYLLFSPGWNLLDDGGTPGGHRFDLKNGDWIWTMPAVTTDASNL